jgi:ribosomal protein S9
MSSLNLLDAIKAKSNTKLAFALVMSFLLSACGAGAGGEDPLDNSANNESQTPTEEEQIPDVVAAVQISSQPQGLTVEAGENASFSISASGGGTLSFQWRKGEQNIDGATSNSLVLTNVSESDAALYDVVVSNSAGSQISLAALLTVNTPIIVIPTIDPVLITSQPQAITVDENASASFSVQVTGDGAISYQWLKDEQTINGATSGSLNIASVSMSDAASYRVQVTNSQGSVLSNAVALTVTALPEAVAIISQPQAITVDENASASFSVQVTGDGEITYQWLKDSQTINGATSASLNIASVSMSDAASYRVQVTNSQGSVLSNAVALTVTALPEPVAITSQPQAITVDENASASFSVQVTGDGTITYQWLKNGEIIDGENSASLSLNSVTSSDAGNYSVIVSNSIVSDAASLNVTVVQVTSSIELTWDIPQAREDGSDLPLWEINGYLIVYGNDENNLSNQLVVEGASNTMAQLLDLASGTYYFAIATVDSDGVQGAYSNVIQQSI